MQKDAHTRIEVETVQGPENYWHLDKRLNVGHLLTTFALAAGLMAWGSKMDQRVAVLEEKAAAQRVIDEKQDTALTQALISMRDEAKGLREDLRETTRKLDRVVELLGRK